MGKKPLNILILDDNPLIANCIEKRIEKCNETFSDFLGRELRPYYFNFELENSEVMGNKIQEYLISKNIKFLLLDRGFFDIFDPNIYEASDLDKDYLYLPTNYESKKIHEILHYVNFSKLQNLEGVILYSFDDPIKTSEWYIEPATIKNEIKDAIGSKINPKNIEVVLTNSEIYSKSGNNLYERDGEVASPEYLYLGKKSDFALYGLFLGEILYHRVHRILKHNKKQFIRSKRNKYIIKLIIIYPVFIFLGIGSNALFNLINIDNQYSIWLTIISILFGLFLPLVILLLKPKWLVDFDE